MLAILQQYCKFSLFYILVFIKVSNVLNYLIKNRQANLSKYLIVIIVSLQYIAKYFLIFVITQNISFRKSRMESNQALKTGSSFRNAGRNTLYNTTNRQYGSVWVQDGQRPQLVNIKTDKPPTYSEVVNSMNDYRKSERLIKNQLIKEKLDQLGIDPQVRINRTTQFPVKQTQNIKYPDHGLNVGPPIYRTNNMNYGSEIPAVHQLPNKFYPCNSSFSKGFLGGTFKFNGLNTTKTVSGVHDFLNDI